MKGKNLTKYILVTASDNYQVVFALAELDKAFTDRTIHLADQVDGKPLQNKTPLVETRCITSPTFILQFIMVLQGFRSSL